MNDQQKLEEEKNVAPKPTNYTGVQVIIDGKVVFGIKGREYKLSSVLQEQIQAIFWLEVALEKAKAYNRLEHF